MSALSLVLWALGIAAVAIGVAMARGPWARYRQLGETEENLRRYDAWRGGRYADDEVGPTGADVMKEQMRQRVILWGAVAVGGVVLIVLGFVLR